MSKHSFICSNCDKRTSTTQDKWFKAKLCPDCRGATQRAAIPTKKDWAQRHPGATALILVLLTLLAAGLIVVLLTGG